VLHQLGLEAWQNTSGWRGPHVVVPLTPTPDYETVKHFWRAITVVLRNNSIGGVCLG